MQAPIVELPFTMDEMNSFVGEYVINSLEMAVNVYVDQGKIYLEPAGQSLFRMMFGGDDTFFLKFDRIRIVFSRDETGNVTGFVLTQLGREFVAVLQI